MPRCNKLDTLYITGLAHEYPPHTVTQEQFGDYVERLYPDAAVSQGLQKLLHLNLRTQILSRPTIFNNWTLDKTEAAPPSVASIARTFRVEGVKLAAAACTKALNEACLSPNDITHVVAVTCTDQSNPGYDLFVSQELGLSPNVQRVLLQGVGCAGGLSALRTAADIAAAASQKGRPARVLVMAMELFSLYLQAELQAALRDPENLHVASVLFSDAAAALVVCNGLALEGGQQKPVFELREWGSMVVPGTADFMSYDIAKNGMIATITKDVPKAAVGAITPMFNKLLNTLLISHKPQPIPYLSAADYDWALHPGGAAILQGAKQALHLTDDHIRASLDVYTHFGNSSSPTVLVVLDKLRRMGEGRDNVVATSFGPGLAIEMCIMRRCRYYVESQPSVTSQLLSNVYKLWPALHYRMTRRVARKSLAMMKVQGT